MKKIISMLFATLMVLSFTSSANAAKTLKCQTVLNTKADEVKMLKDFTDTVTTLTGGSLKFEILPAGAVVGVKETLDAVDKGLIDCGFAWTHYWSGDHPAAMLAHYNAIRSRHHCGRNWYKSMGSRILFTPLMDSRFIAMDLFNLKNGFHPTKIFVDAFSATGQWAMDIPFETPSRRFDEDLVNNSPFKDGIALSPMKYTIYGTPESQTSEDLPDIFDIPMETGYKDEMIKTLLSRSFYASKQTWQSDVFTEEDIARASEEIKNEGTLSHGYRMVAHILSVDMIRRILNQNESFQP